MPYKSLPSNPSLDHLKHQARDLQKALRDREPQALQRLQEFHPRAREVSPAIPSLSDAQLVVAREYCFPSWPRLKKSVEQSEPAQAKAPYHERIQDPNFRKAVELLDAGDEHGLRHILSDHPEILKQRAYFGIDDYFGRPFLLSFVAENPIRRGELTSNIVAIARTILEAGAKKERDAVDHALGLVSSGRVAREFGHQVALIDLLCDYGANPEKAKGPALVHGEFAAAEALLRRGAKLDLPTASALGRTEDARGLLGDASELDRHLALALASQFGRFEIVRLLLDAGEDPNRFNPIGGHSHSTPLHQAAIGGHLDVVKLLVERGADGTVKDILFGGTPLGWAKHGGQEGTAAYLMALETTK